MIELKDGMLLFHGSYTAIPDINLAACNRGLDFGQGFYEFIRGDRYGDIKK